MNVSLEQIQRCSAQTGYAVLPLEKVIRLGDMAGDVARHPFLGNVLALKGGTLSSLPQIPKPAKISFATPSSDSKVWNGPP